MKILTNIKLYKIKRWNYFDKYRHVTNNDVESCNAKFNNLFQKKPTYFKLIYELLLEEASIINEYKKRQTGLIGSGNWRTAILINYMENITAKIEEIQNMYSNNDNDKKILKKLGMNI